MKKRGIRARETVWKEYAYRVVGDLKTTDFVMNNTFWIGVYPGMTDEMIDHMANVVLDAINE